MDIKIMAGAEPFYFPGGAVGCLVMHGLSASPQEVYWLGQSLAKHGATVYGPRLYGHGLTAEHMLYMRWQDWYASALDGYHLLKQTCDRVFAVGFSMGSLLALRLAASEAVAGVVGLAVPFEPPAKGAWLAHFLRYVVPYVAHYDQATDRIDKRVRELQQARGERVTGRVGYWKQSTVGLSELLKLQAEIGAKLACVKAPVLLVASEKDTTARISNLESVSKRLTNSARVETLRLKESEHILTNDIEDETVFAATWEFISKNSRK